MSIQIQDAVVLIRSNDPKINRFGTGFIIYKEKQTTYILTCAHVVKDVGGIDAIRIGDLEASVVASGEMKSIDLAVLKVNGLIDKPILELIIADQRITDLQVVGFQSYSDGRLSRPLHGRLGNQVGFLSDGQSEKVKAWDIIIEDEYYLQPGYSGSPVIDENGKVFGVISHRQGEGNKGIAIAIEILKDIWPERSSDLFEETIIGKEDLIEAIDADLFYGREGELNEIREWIITERCKLVIISGIGGIGKSAFCMKLVEHVKKHFEYIFWRSIQNGPLLNEILFQLIHFLSDQQKTNLPDDTDQLIKFTLSYLTKHKCLIVFDNLESIMRGSTRTGFFRKEYENYDNFFRAIGETKHQSTLLITTREEPKFSDFIDAKKKKVEGLDQDNCQKILQNKKLTVTDKPLLELVKRFSGNPLALKLVASAIIEQCSGDIDEYLKLGTKIFGGIYELLDEQFERLNAHVLEKNIMYWLAIEREPLSSEQLMRNIGHGVNQRKILETIDSLKKRSLIETSKLPGRVTLQPAVMEYVTDKLVESVCEEIYSGTYNLVKTHALIKAQTKDYVRNSQIRLILQPLLELLLTFGSESHIERKLTELLSIARDRFLDESNFMAGSIINLLNLMKKGDLSQFDFSRLHIREAFFRSSILHNVDLSYAEVNNSEFTEKFGIICSVAFSPDGKLLAIGNVDGDIRLWQVSNYKQVVELSEHTGWVFSVAFSHDGQIIASGGGDQIVKIWDINTAKCLKTLKGHFSRVWSVAFSPDDKILASAGEDRTIRLWDVSTGECLNENNPFKEHTGGIRTIAFSPKDLLIASASEDGTVRLWDIKKMQCKYVLHDHTKAVRTVVFDKDGKTLLSSGDDKTIKVWDVETGQLINVLGEHKKAVWTIAMTSDAKILVSGGEDLVIRLWDIDSKKILRTLEGHTNRIRSIAFDPTDTIIASGSHDQTLRIWDRNTGQILKVLQGFTSQVLSVAFCPKGNVFATGSDDQKITLWDSKTYQVIQTLKGHTNRIWALKFNSDGSMLASGGDDCTIRVWNVANGESQLVLPGHSKRIWALAFNPEDSLLSSGGADNIIYIWDLKSGKHLRTLSGHTDRVMSVIFSADGQTLISGSDDKSIKFWDLKTLECVTTLKEHTGGVTSVAFSPNGKLLASGSEDNSIRIWKMSTQKCINLLEGHSKQVRAIAFCGNNSILASGSEDQSIRIWDIQQGKCLRILKGHTNWIESLASSPNGDQLVSVSDDETIKIWDVQTGECLKTLHHIRPYEQMNITGIRGITEAQTNTLKALGAIESES